MKMSAKLLLAYRNHLMIRFRQGLGSVRGEMLAKMAELASRARTSVDGAGPSATDGDVGKTSANVAAEGGTSKSTTGAPVRDTSKSGTCAAEGGTNKSASAGAVGGTSNANTSTSGASSPGQKKSNDSSLYDDLPSFDLLNSDGIDDDCSTPPEITRKGAPSSFLLFLFFLLLSASSPFFADSAIFMYFHFVFLFSFQL
jgi:hypothetical protein